VNVSENFRTFFNLLKGEANLNKIEMVRCFISVCTSFLKIVQDNKMPALFLNSMVFKES